MKIIREGHELAPGKVCLAIGVFDGVHLGHQQIIRQTISDAEHHEARAIVVTFDRHPNTVVAPDRVPPSIYTLSQKLQAIEALSPHATLLIHFDHAFSCQTGQAFIEALRRDFGTIQSICVGRNFTFGHKRSGNVALLQQLGAELHFNVHALAALALDGDVISSTRIRDAIRAGQIDAASQMLGRSYAVAGPVVAGDRLGQQLGFPTANLDVTGLVLPPTGVYAAHVHSYQRSFRAVLNIGYRPTVDPTNPALRVEVHLLDFQGDLYGQELEVTFVSRLRSEQKFDSLTDLKAQIAQDITAARALFDQG